jgi:hypothetical protein
MSDGEKITPTEELILELLVARCIRLGHNLWTFGANPTSTRAAKSLERKGYLILMHGAVEHTFRAIPTDKTRAQFATKNYVPPILGGPK